MTEGQAASPGTLHAKWTGLPCHKCQVILCKSQK